MLVNPNLPNGGAAGQIYSTAPSLAETFAIEIAKNASLSDLQGRIVTTVSTVASQLKSSKHTTHEFLTDLIAKTTAAMTSLDEEHKRSLQFITDTMEGLLLAADAFEDNKLDKKLLKKERDFVQCFKGASQEINTKHDEKAKLIFEAFSKNVLTREVKLKPFADLAMDSSYALRVRHWASALYMLNREMNK